MGPKSKPGCVGNDMKGALKGEQDNNGKISKNYQGRPANADPNYAHSPSSGSGQSVSDWTKGHMKKKREEAAEKKKDEKK